MTNRSISTFRCRPSSDLTRWATRWIAASILSVWGGWATAQAAISDFSVGTLHTALLVIDLERAFNDSAYGQRISLELDQGRDEIAAENRQIEAELTEEERALTLKRGAMDPAAFRKLADDFDEKVQRLRREQDVKARDLVTRQDEARRRFVAASQPILKAIMVETGAVVILEKRNVVAASDAVDITDRTILGINTALGESGADPQRP